MREDYESVKRREEEVCHKINKLRAREKQLDKENEELSKREQIALKLKEKLRKTLQMTEQNRYLLNRQIK